MKTYIIILHFGQLSVTQACIASLYKIEKTIFFTVIVNNANEKISEKDFQNKERLHVINNLKNVGFAKGVNIGIKYALSQKADSIILLNNDTTLTESILPGLLSDLELQHVGIVAPAIRFKKQKVFLHDIGGELNTWTGKTSHTEVAVIKDKSLRSRKYVSGCCMAVKSDVFKKIGFFDEKFFLYYEDVDFCLRTNAAGYKIVVDPSIVIEHELSKSAGKLSNLSMYHQIRSARIFGKKYFSSGIKSVIQKIFVIFQVMIFVIKSHHASPVKALFSKI